eukprot:496245-Pleurochrysis_carterae.AAC.2
MMIMTTKRKVQVSIVQVSVEYPAFASALFSFISCRKRAKSMMSTHNCTCERRSERESWSWKESAGEVYPSRRSRVGSADRARKSWHVAAPCSSTVSVLARPALSPLPASSPRRLGLLSPSPCCSPLSALPTQLRSCQASACFSTYPDRHIQLLMLICQPSGYSPVLLLILMLQHAHTCVLSTVTTYPPVLPTYPPVLPTYPPVLPSYPPVLPTYPPILPTYPPVLSTYPPVLSTYPPVLSIYPPVLSTYPPVLSTYPPV